jgi:hypothetical protein
MTPCRRETRKIPMTATDVKRGRNITRQLACSSTTFTRSTSIRCDWNSDSRSVLGLAAALLQFVDDPINSTISSDAPALVTSTTNSTIASDEGVLRTPKADRTAPGLVASTSNSTIASDEGEAHWTAVRSYSTLLPTKPR